MNKWRSCMVGVSYWETLCGTFWFGLESGSVSKTFKIQGENVSIWIIRRKGMVQGWSQNGRELEEILFRPFQTR